MIHKKGTVSLTPREKKELDDISNIAKRGEFVAKIYLKLKYEESIDFNCNKIPGADISALVAGVPTAFEVKATRDSDVALGKMKVSSKDSYRLIIGGAPVLRVMEADKPNPMVMEIFHGVDFKLKEEPRWRAEKP